ncbi:YWFCY domain-containing protein [Dyadobacter fanqingshengii]|uniref:YWFCY domain-containing protein n=1 Tax=Dyadobacter fanqingshengii TaxID=2906443 RepID=UPI0035B5A096
MASNTGENEISLRKIADITRLISILVLALHFNYFCYQAFQNWHLTSLISDRILDKILPQGCSLRSVKRRLQHSFFLIISLVGVKGKKGGDLRIKPALISVLTGFIIYFLSVFILKTLSKSNLDQLCIWDLPQLVSY